MAKMYYPICVLFASMILLISTLEAHQTSGIKVTKRMKVSPSSKKFDINHISPLFRPISPRKPDGKTVGSKHSKTKLKKVGPWKKSAMMPIFIEGRTETETPFGWRVVYQEQDSLPQGHIPDYLARNPFFKSFFNDLPPWKISVGRHFPFPDARQFPFPDAPQFPFPGAERFPFWDPVRPAPEPPIVDGIERLLQQPDLLKVNTDLRRIAKDFSQLHLNHQSGTPPMSKTDLRDNLVHLQDAVAHLGKISRGFSQLHLDAHKENVQKSTKDLNDDQHKKKMEHLNSDEDPKKMEYPRSIVEKPLGNGFALNVGKVEENSQVDSADIHQKSEEKPSSIHNNPGVSPSSETTGDDLKNKDVNNEGENYPPLDGSGLQDNVEENKAHVSVKPIHGDESSEEANARSKRRPRKLAGARVNSEGGYKTVQSRPDSGVVYMKNMNTNMMRKRSAPLPPPRVTHDGTSGHGEETSAPGSRGTDPSEENQVSNGKTRSLRKKRNPYEIPADRRHVITHSKPHLIKDHFPNIEPESKIVNGELPKVGSLEKVKEDLHDDKEGTVTAVQGNEGVEKEEDQSDATSQVTDVRTTPQTDDVTAKLEPKGIKPKTVSAVPGVHTNHSMAPLTLLGLILLFVALVVLLVFLATRTSELSGCCSTRQGALMASSSTTALYPKADKDAHSFYNLDM